MAKTELRPRVMGALAVVALSLFMLICLMSYGKGGFEDAGQLGWQAWVGSLLLEVFGAGAYVLVLSPLAWGVVVYFQERTSQLRLRAAATVVLAISVAVIAGLLQGGEQDIWAGAVGSAAVAVIGWVSTLVGQPLAEAFAWTLALGTFVVSLVVATDWIFHTLRRGAPPVIAQRIAPLTPAPEPAVEDRERVIEAALEASVDEAPEEAIAEEELSLAEPATEIGPDASPYANVEFMAPSDELAVEVREAVPAYVDEAVAATPIDDEWLTAEEDDDVLAEPPVEETATGDAGVASLAPAFDPLVRPLSEAHAAADLIDEELPNGSTEPATEPDAVAEVDVDVDVGLDVADTAEATADEPNEGHVVDEVFTVTDAAVDAGPTSVTGGIAAAGIAAEILDGEPVGSREAEATGFEEALGPERRFLFEDQLGNPPPGTPEASPAFDAGEEESPADPDTQTLAQNRLSQHLVVDDLIVGSAAVHELDEVALADDAGSPAAEDPAAGPTELDLGGLTELDPKFQSAVEVVLTREKASAMVLQRHLGIGYPRAVRLLEQMTTAGILGPDEGDWAGARRIHVTRAEWDAFLATYAS